jgi:ribokinase
MVDVITIGGATKDIFFEVREASKRVDKENLSRYLEIPYGAKLLSSNTYYFFGGGAVNAAVGLSRLGLKTAILCNIGAEGTGDQVTSYLRKNRVNTGLICRDHSLHTGLSMFIIGKDNEHTGILERGANNHLCLRRIGPLKRTNWFYISSLTGTSEHILDEVFGLAKKRGIKVAFNPGSQQLAKGYHYLAPFMDLAEVLIVNMDEARQIIKSKNRKIPKTEDEVINSMAKLGAANTVITNDEKGSYVISGGKVYHQAALPTEIVDTTGAGDAFGLTFIYGMIRGFDVRHCLKIAAINASSVISKMGAGDGLLTYNKIRSSKWF